jgi:hypothetical protein
MVTFLDSGHKFTVAAAAIKQDIDFGNRLFFTVLTSGMPIQQIEQTLASGGSLFGSSLVFPAITFDAQCVVTMPKATSPQFPELKIRADLEFGFVQGLQTHDIHLEYWGQIAANGRSILHITMPGTFEVDTDLTIAPWSRAASSRFTIRNITQAALSFNSLRISSNFDDHPMYSFAHTVQHTLPNNVVVPHFIRSVRFKRVFRTNFCFRKKKTGNFTAISSVDWSIEYDHLVNYSQNGTVRTVVDNVAGHTFPSKGSPSNINQTDRDIMGMAKAGAPLLTPTVLQTRMQTPTLRTVTREAPNADFVSGFWT